MYNIKFPQSVSSEHDSNVKKQQQSLKKFKNATGNTFILCSHLQTQGVCSLYKMSLTYTTRSFALFRMKIS
jgi:hypothetical protein